MPELPEVETVMRGLAPVMQGPDDCSSPCQSARFALALPASNGPAADRADRFRAAATVKIYPVGPVWWRNLIGTLGHVGPHVDLGRSVGALCAARIQPLQNMTMWCLTWPIKPGLRLMIRVGLVLWI